MEEHRAHRLKEEHLGAQIDRICLLERSLPGLAEKNWGKVILPSICDLKTTEPILTLVKAPTEETVDFPESVILESAQNWRTTCDTALRNMVVVSTTPTSGSNGVDLLSLATTFFSCWRKDYSCNVLQYPEVLKHKCATTNPFRYQSPWPWNEDGERVFFSEKAYSLTKIILETAGFNPDTTTRDDVQWPAFIVECQQCSNPKSGHAWRLLMSWPVAIRHAQRHDIAGERLHMSRANLNHTKRLRVHNLAADYFKDKLLQGMVDTGNTKLSSMEQLDQLRSRRKAWARLNRKTASVVQINGICHVYELVGGVFAHGDSGGTEFVISSLPSSTFCGNQFRCRDIQLWPKDFAIDPGQDLIVFIGAQDPQ
ncbi:hypothetical protein C0992_000791 [Termitomyces sp. T32_za158]|nr:hypothetical protein C0992_000791 [Termitomyces sp. T32_za158]